MMERISRKTTGPIIIIGILFFVFGFVTWLNAVLVPYLRIACELNNFQSYLVAFSFYIAYFFASVPSGWFLGYTGYRKGMAAGLLIMALGALLFVPAALTRTYGLFLAGLFVQGTGMALLQTAANPYVTIIGPIESAARRISIMGICNGIAGVLAPSILGFIILEGADEIVNKLGAMTAPEKIPVLDSMAGRVILPYLLIMISLILLAVFIRLAHLPEVENEQDENGDHAISIRKTSIFQFPHLLLGVLAIFLYTGVEVIAGNTIISYGVFLGVSISTARFFSSLTLMGMLIGYIIGIALIPKYLSQKNALGISAVGGLLFGSAALVTNGFTSILFIALLGLANSLMWPSIWPLAIDNLGRFTKIGSAMMVMAISGAAVLPLTYGWLADHFTPKSAYLLVIPVYLFILFYAVIGHRAGRHRDYVDLRML
jgi:MFS transporter, FHS family, L-fucose permease